jgi:hypothetical protein
MLRRVVWYIFINLTQKIAAFIFRVDKYVVERYHVSEELAASIFRPEQVNIVTCMSDYRRGLDW